MSRKKIGAKFKYDFASQTNAQLANMAVKIVADIRVKGAQQSQLCHYLEEVAKRLAT